MGDDRGCRSELTAVPSPRRLVGSPAALPPVALLSRGVFSQGWMNEMYFYDPEIYHPSVTHSVFVTLEDSALKLSYPRSNIPRRATFEEEIAEPTFVNHRHYDMSGTKVTLRWDEGSGQGQPLLTSRDAWRWNDKKPVVSLNCTQFSPVNKAEAKPSLARLEWLSKF